MSLRVKRKKIFNRFLFLRLLFIKKEINATNLQGVESRRHHCQFIIITFFIGN